MGPNRSSSEAGSGAAPRPDGGVEALAQAGNLAQAAAMLRAGRLVAFPTETVYGLGANALDAEAVARIFAAKGRPSTSPLIVHVTGPEMAQRQVVSAWPAAAEALAQAFWPGPLTLVLPKRPEIPPGVTAGLATVGVRQPAHPLAQALLTACGLPLAAPSANLFTQLSPTTAEHVRQGLGDRVDLVLDGGPCAVGLESTVLSLAGERPVLLRPGMISRQQIEAVIGPVSLPSARAEAAAGDELSDSRGQGAVGDASPGLHWKHYSPRRPLRLGFPQAGRPAVYLWYSQERPATYRIEMPAEVAAYAARLYGALHEADGLPEVAGAETAGPESSGLESLGLEIVVEPPPEGPEWEAVADRLRRAAAK